MYISALGKSHVTLHFNIYDIAVVICKVNWQHDLCMYEYNPFFLERTMLSFVFLNKKQEQTIPVSVDLEMDENFVLL